MGQGKGELLMSNRAKAGGKIPILRCVSENQVGRYILVICIHLFIQCLENFCLDLNHILLVANEPLKMSTEYYHIGTQKAMGTGNVKPFGAFSLGATRFYLKESYGNAYEYAEWAMSFALGLVAKILVSDKIGFRLQARMGVPMIFNRLWVGTGGTGASVQIPVWQFDFSAGVILRLSS